LKAFTQSEIGLHPGMTRAGTRTARVATLTAEMHRTRWLFVALCSYLAAQSFMVPVLALGPSWAVWPRLADFAFGALALAFVGCWQDAPRASGPNERLLYLFSFALAACALSYVGYLAFVGNEIGSVDGGYYLYRSVQFLALFGLTSRVPLTEARVRILAVIVDVVLVFVCIMVLATYFAIVPLGIFTAHLPRGDSLGLWYLFELLSGQRGFGWGTISYNHAYTAIQILLLVGLRMHLAAHRSELSHALMLLLGLGACLLTESRAGLVSIGLLAAVHFAKRPMVMAGAVLLSGLLLLAVEATNPRADRATLGDTLQHQMMALDATDERSLNGRSAIWANRIALLDERPQRWLIGTGFGAARDTGSVAHNQFLQVTFETGLIGLAAFLFVTYRILAELYRHEVASKAIFWTTVALLVSSMTQETFYPVPALGHFLGFYLCALAIALREPAREQGASSKRVRLW
jgi:O-antigen ligase